MLVLKRKPGEKIVIEGGITILIQSIRGQSVKVCIDAPREKFIHREEVWGLAGLDPAKSKKPISAA